jgi:hypothetical protein
MKSTMPEPIGKLWEIKPGVWINPDAVAMAACVANGAWMMPGQTGSDIGNHEQQRMLVLTLWDGSSIALTEQSDIVNAAWVLKLPHPCLWKVPIRPVRDKVGRSRALRREPRTPVLD